MKEPDGGLFTSPNYPNKYPPNTECVYILEGKYSLEAQEQGKSKGDPTVYSLKLKYSLRGIPSNFLENEMYWFIRQ